MENTWDGEENPNGFSVVGIEVLGDIDDTNFLFITDPDSASFYEDSPLWNALPFVEVGTAYRLNDSLWLFGGPLSAQRLVDSVLEVMGVEMMASAVVDCAASFHAIEDAAGEVVCLPESPERIVALTEVDIDSLLALGVEPLAVTNGRGQQVPPGFLEASLPVDVVSTGTFFQPNLEVILEQEPDLILFAGYSGFGDPEVLEQLNAIAPVFNAATFAEPWQTHILRLGDVLNLEAEAEAVITEYDERIASLREALGDNAGSEFVVVL